MSLFVSVCLCDCVRSNQSTSKHVGRHCILDLSKLIVCTPCFSLGVSLLPNFQKGGGSTGSQFLEGVTGKEEVTFFQGVSVKLLKIT